jgi:hypothetical protein
MTNFVSRFVYPFVSVYTFTQKEIVMKKFAFVFVVLCAVCFGSVCNDAYADGWGTVTDCVKTATPYISYAGPVLDTANLALEPTAENAVATAGSYVGSEAGMATGAFIYWELHLSRYRYCNWCLCRWIRRWSSWRERSP